MPRTHTDAVRADRRGAVPVVAVVLMVAVAVVLAALVGFFVLDVNADTRPVPNTSFGFEYDSPTSGDLTIEHAGGETIDAKNTGKVEVRYTGVGGADHSVEWSLPIASTDALTLSTDPKPGTKVRILWIGPEGDQTDFLKTYTVPT